MIQIKIPVGLEKNIEITDPIYTFNEVMEQIDLTKYYHESKIQSKKARNAYFLYFRGLIFAIPPSVYFSPIQKKANKVYFFQSSG